MENFGAEGLQGVAAVPRSAMMGPALTFDIVGRSTRFGRDGYWRRNVQSGFPVGTLTTSGWNVNHKRVERVWRWKELGLSAKQPKRGRPPLKDRTWAKS